MKKSKGACKTEISISLILFKPCCWEGSEVHYHWQSIFSSVTSSCNMLTLIVLVVFFFILNNLLLTVQTMVHNKLTCLMILDDLLHGEPKYNRSCACLLSVLGLFVCLSAIVREPQWHSTETQKGAPWPSVPLPPQNMANWPPPSESVRHPLPLPTCPLHFLRIGDNSLKRQEIAP